MLKHIYEELNKTIGTFQEINFQHVSRERNVLADQLSRMILQVGDDIRHRLEMNNDTLTEHDRRPHLG